LCRASVSYPKTLLEIKAVKMDVANIFNQNQVSPHTENTTEIIATIIETINKIIKNGMIIFAFFIYQMY